MSLSSTPTRRRATELLFCCRRRLIHFPARRCCYASLALTVPRLKLIRPVRPRRTVSRESGAPADLSGLPAPRENLSSRRPVSSGSSVWLRTAGGLILFSPVDLGCQGRLLPLEVEGTGVVETRLVSAPLGAVCHPS